MRDFIDLQQYRHDQIRYSGWPPLYLKCYCTLSNELIMRFSIFVLSRSLELLVSKPESPPGLSISFYRGEGPYPTGLIPMSEQGERYLSWSHIYFKSKFKQMKYSWGLVFNWFDFRMQTTWCSRRQMADPTRGGWRVIGACLKWLLIDHQPIW